MIGVFNITFYNPSRPTTKTPVVGVSRNALFASPMSATYLGSSGKKFVKLGYDATLKLVAIVPCDENDPQKIKMPTLNKNGMTFSVKSFYAQVGLDVEKLLPEGRTRFSFPAFWHEQSKMLLVDIAPKRTTRPWE